MIATTWRIDTASGPQDWSWRRERFDSVTVAGCTYSLANHDVDGLAVKTGDAPQCETCRGLLPGVFTYCPSCGSRLKHVGAPASMLWASPVGHSSGLCRLERRIGIDPVSEQFILPIESDALAFVCAGTPRRLVAIERELGQTFVFSASRQRWLKVDSHAGYAARPRWSWAAVAAENGIAFPTDGSPVWMQLSGTELLIEAFNADALSLSCLAGALLVEDSAYVPVATSKAPLAIARRAPKSPWTLIEVSGIPDDALQPAALGAPVHNAAGHVFWPSADGYICLWREGTRDVASWRSWLDKERALQNVRPCRYQNDLFQLVQSADGYAYQSMVARNRPAERHTVDGPCLSADDVHFRGLARRDAPWREDVITLSWREGFLLPLLSFPGKFVFGLWIREVAERNLLLEGMEARADAEFYSVTPQGSGISLNQSVRLTALDDINFFIFGNWLYVYQASAARGWRWPYQSVPF